VDRATFAPVSSVEASNPLQVLARWLAEAQAAGLPEPSAMALGTTSVDGWPSVRIVLCRGVDERRGVRFFTNYESRKGRELDATGRGAATFHWATLERQVRVEGLVERATPEESDAYFHSRPRGSQIASAVSPQSRPIASVQELRDRGAELSARVEGGEVERPSWWGGYWLVARAVELWHGGPDRLHDRVRYELDGGAWRGTRLGP
jgi:pyridoxamine 5'-phosphate oxidase